MKKPETVHKHRPPSTKIKQKGYWESANKPSLRVHRQSAAKEFESYKQLPKYTKPSLAVIHPIHQKPSDKNKNLDNNLDLNSRTKKFFTKPLAPN